MKNIRLVLTALSLLIAGSIFSQSSNTELTLPNYPALSIIGSQTTEVTKPGDFTGLQTSIISPLVSNDGTIPSDLAVEFQPYFLNSERRTLADYLEMNNNRNIGKLVARSSKISIASNDLMASDSSIYSRVGIGYRTLLLEPKISDAYTKDNRSDQMSKLAIIIQTIRRMKEGDNLTTGQVLSVYKKEWLYSSEVVEVTQNFDYINDKKAMIKELEKIRDKLNTNEPWVNPAVYNPSLRKGLFIEFAFATSIDFEDRNISNIATFQRYGTWFNFTYKLSDKKERSTFYMDNLGALVRLSNYSLDPSVVFDKTGTFFDLGANFQLGITKKLDLTGEYLLRSAASDFSTQIGEKITDVSSGTTESKFSATLVLHVSDNVSTTFSYSLINGEQSYTPDNIQMLMLGLTAAILPMK